jgi:protein-arginine kinase activator protein McsA
MKHLLSAKQEDAQKPQLSKLEQLEKQLLDAIAKEDYERAAQLRDEIKKLQAHNS